MPFRHLTLSLALCLPLSAQEPSPSPLDTTSLARADREITSAVSSGRIPGAVLHIERDGQIYEKAFGKKSTYPRSEPNAKDTIYDAASLTKVVATAPSILHLIEKRNLSLEGKVQKFLPEFTGDPNKATVTLRHLLTHTSGLLPGIRKGYEWEGCENGIALACAEPSVATAGASYAYSDINFILLGEIVRRVSGQPLDKYATAHLFAPLKMAHTSFLPARSELPRIAPTTRMPDRSVLRGTVHDPTARAMGGVAGHAGLFTTASDLARFARMILNGGHLEGARVLTGDSVSLMTSVQSPPGVSALRGLGWDIDSPYASLRGDIFPLGSFGHTGWTGTSLWIDPFSRSSVILLSNRNHPTESGSVGPLRKRLGTIAAESVSHFDFSAVPDALLPVSISPTRPEVKTSTRPSAEPAVRNGIDVLAAQNFAPLKGLKVGLITNHTGTDRTGIPTIDLLHKSDQLTLAALFSPEHGIRGTADHADIRDATDEKTGLKIHSLYAGPKRKPTPAQLAGLDALVFDIQDIGCRFYTYISTMGLCMEAASEAGIKFFILDRVNPLGGTSVEGPVLDGKTSFTGFHQIPVRHGMTVGEIARMLRSAKHPDLDLTVVPLEGWDRTLFFDQTGLPWHNPSPNIRSLAAAILYPGVGLLEFTNLSVGRGTRMPFELVGAPFIDPEKLAEALRSTRLPGAAFVPVRFTPDSSVFNGQPCGGLRLIVTDRNAFQPVDLGIELAKALHRLYPDEWKTAELDKLLVHPKTAAAILADAPLPEIRSLWTADRATFATLREAALLYPR